jgi:5-guanidino-2-oxopentanoate decarboxylase
MGSRPLGAQIAHMLKARGIDTVFGIPGVHNLELYRGIETAGLTHVLARHEQGAGFMADGYARATGRPGVALVISGPGLTNIMTPMGQAWSDSVPMLVLSSCLDETAARKGQLHQMRDQEGAAASVCEWSETARSVQAAYGLIDRALAEFAAFRPRPKHIQLPIPLLAAPASAAPDPVEYPGPPVPRPEIVAAVAERLLDAKQPLFIFGGGARGGAKAARALLAATGAAAMTSYAGRGVIPGDHPQNFGACLARPGSVAEIARADLVLAIGTELAEVDLWRERLGHEAPLVRVDIDPGVLADAAVAEVPVLGDAGLFLEALLTLIEPKVQRCNGWPATEIAAVRTRFRAETDAERPGIAAVCDALAASLPKETMIFSDMTQFAYAAKEIWPMRQPGHWHHPFGFGTLGWALPAAIGGKIGRADLPVLAIAGDYGFQYTLPELAVAVELELPLPILLWDNGKLGEIEDNLVRAQIPPWAAQLRNPDFLALARAFGAETAAPDDLTGLVRAVQAAFGAKAPTLIRVTPDIAA